MIGCKKDLPLVKMEDLLLRLFYRFPFKYFSSSRKVENMINKEKIIDVSYNVELCTIWLYHKFFRIPFKWCGDYETEKVCPYISR